jgi:hypothetical protein
MTEERMICEMELVWSNIGPSYKWMPVDEAPPKDWRPICYDSQYNKMNGCDPINPIVRTCQQCPFLASRHKTKVTQKSGGLDINLDINGQVKE